MTDTHTETQEKEEKLLPFVASSNILPINAPVKWIQQGAEDMKRAPVVSLSYGLAMTLLSVLIAYGSWKFGTLGLYLGMASGFLLLGPVLAIGLYSFSCQLEQGRKPIVGYCVREGGSHIKDMLIFSFILLIVFLVWARAATAIHIFFPENADYTAFDLAWVQSTLLVEGWACAHVAKLDDLGVPLSDPESERRVFFVAMR